MMMLERGESCCITIFEQGKGWDLVHKPQRSELRTVRSQLQEGWQRTWAQITVGECGVGGGSLWKFFSDYFHFLGKQETRAEKEAGEGGIGGSRKRKYETVDQESKRMTRLNLPWLVFSTRDTFKTVF